MDVVYYIGWSPNNAELRFSLRSVAQNLTHDRVIISGYPPDWTQNVAKLKVQGGSSSKKFLNAARNIMAACEWEGTSDEFILMNDDFFVIRPIEEVPTLHRGTLARAMENHQKRWGRNTYFKGMQATMRYLNELGYDDPLAYHLHLPMVINKELMREVLIDTGVTRTGKRPDYLLRTIYGNVAEIGGTKSRDVKVASTKSAALTTVMKMKPAFLSTSDQSFRHGAVGRWITGLFPEPCEYEMAAQPKTRNRRAHPQHPHRQR